MKTKKGGKERNFERLVKELIWNKMDKEELQ